MIEVNQGRGTKGKKGTPKRPPKGSHRKKNTEYCEKIHKRGRSDGVHKTFFSFFFQNQDILSLLSQTNYGFIKLCLAHMCHKRDQEAWVCKGAAYWRGGLSQLFQKLSVALIRGNCALMNNMVPSSSEFGRSLTFPDSTVHYCILTPKTT